MQHWASIFRNVFPIRFEYYQPEKHYMRGPGPACKEASRIPAE